jgi:thiosulfate oxidation carrier complex protein SoxZ
MLELRTLSAHPMETGRHKDESGQLIAAHFIASFVVTLNGEAVIDMDSSQGLSANPTLGFRLRGVKPGDLIAVTWEDNLGIKASQSLLIN